MEFNIARFKEHTEGLKLLYVEEDASFRGQVETILARFFPHIDALDNGQEAYESFLEHKHDVIITDIVLPGLNGVEMISKIKSKGYKPLIIVLSAYNDLEHMIELIHLHIDYFSIKPFTNKEFVLKLYELVLERFGSADGNENVTPEVRLAQLEEIATVYNSVEEGIVVCEGNSIVRVNKSFLELSSYKDFETLKLEMPHIGTLFVVCPEALNALDNETFIKQLRQSDPAESTVIIAKNGHYQEYMITCVELEDTKQFVLTFTKITDVLKKYKKDLITGLPNKFALQRKLRILNMEKPNFNVIVITMKHFAVFINYYGKFLGNKLERYLVDLIHKTILNAGNKDNCYFAQYDQNQYIIVSTFELESLMKSLVKVHLNEFVISADKLKTVEKKKIDINPIFKLSTYKSEPDPEIIEVHIMNDFDELNYSYL